jgi:hypothetical protein
MADFPILDLSINREGFFRKEVPEILQKLKGDERPIWGEMTVQHMIEHLIFPLKIAQKEIDFGIFTPEERIAKQQAFLESPMGLPKNFPFPGFAPGYLPPLFYSTLEEAKLHLLSEIQQFMNFLKDNEKERGNHPVFGKLNDEQWLIFQYKHFMHHFMQFGLI